MSKNIKAVIIFLLLFLFGQWLIIGVLDYIMSHSQFRFSKLYNNRVELDHDVLCIGNSRTLNSLYTPYMHEKYNIDAYNISFNGMSVHVAEAMVREYYELHKNPKTVIAEVSNIFIEDNSNEAANFNIYSNRSKNIKRLINESDPLLSAITKAFPLYRYNNELLFRSLFYIKKSDQTWINRYSIPDDYAIEINQLPEEQLVINPIHVESLLSLKKVIEENGSQPIFFLAPYYPSYVGKLNNIDEVLVELEQLLEIKVIDLSVMDIPSEGYADKIHTNHIGAPYIVDTLVQLIKI